MGRFYLIGVTTFLVFIMWFNGAHAKTVLVDHPKVTNKSVQEHEDKAYVPCLNKRLVQIKEAFNGPMKEDSAVANAVSILRECDGHLIELGSWLQSMGEPKEKVMRFMDRERNHFGKEMIEYLKKGLIAKREHKEGSSHKHE